MLLLSVGFFFVCLYEFKLFFTRYCCVRAVVKLHDEQSEGLPRRLIIEMVKTAGGGKLTHTQASNLWDQTILPLGKRKGLLTGYVKAQEGTSKRTAAGKIHLQRAWHELVDDLFDKVRQHAKKILVHDALVDKMMPYLICNMDEECLHALGKNEKVCGSKEKKKHDNQNGSSRFVAAFCFCIS